jgi:hypothetical protein
MDAFRASLLVVADAGLFAAVAWAAAREHAPGLARPLAASAVAGVAVGLLAWAAAVGRGLVAADLALPLLRLRHLHALALLGGVLLLRRHGVAAAPARPWRILAEWLALAMGLAAALPSGAALGGLLRDEAVLAGAWPGVAAAAAAGALAGGAIGAGAAWLLARTGAARVLPPSAFLALLLALALVGIGAAGAQLPPLGQGLAGVAGRIVHDGLHVAFVFLQLPDHPYLKDEVYQGILLLLDPLPHAVVAALLVGAPVAVAWRAFARRPRLAAPVGSRPPERRIAEAAFRRRSRIAGAAFALALCGIAAGIATAALQAADLYDPIPEPVADDGRGTVIVSLGGPMGGGDGRMRKYVWSYAGHLVPFFTVRRPDGSLAAALDLCEICQPKGYAQLGAGHVFCKYCKTPIPVATVGEPGGCNPIPLPSARVQGAALRIPAAELRRLYERALEAAR